MGDERDLEGTVRDLVSRLTPEAALQMYDEVARNPNHGQNNVLVRQTNTAGNVSPGCTLVQYVNCASLSVRRSISGLVRLEPEDRRSDELEIHITDLDAGTDRRQQGHT